MDFSLSLGLSAAALFLYNLIALLLRRASGLTLMLRSGSAWAAKHVAGRSAPDVTLAIQTLRNTVLVATFIGTLSFTVASATLAALPGAPDGPARVRGLLQAGLLTGAFLNFALVIRCAAHAGYAIGSATGAEAGISGSSGGGGATAPALLLPPPVPAELDSLVHMQAVHFSLGFRCMYCAIPFSFAVAGPEALVVVTSFVICFLFYIDHAIWIWGGGGCGRPPRAH